MEARTKFIAGGAIILATVGYLMATGIQETGVYYLTPTELASRVRADSAFHDVGVKLGARVLRGSIVREPATRTLRFQATDGQVTYPVEYRGLVPDTFTDEVDVVLEGRLGADGVFRAATLLAKCGSRYEAAPERT